MEIQTLNILEIRKWFIDSTIKSISNKESNFVKSISESLLNLLGLQEKVRSISFKRDLYYFEKENKLELLPNETTFKFDKLGLFVKKTLISDNGKIFETILIDYDLEKKPISLIWNLPNNSELNEVFSIKCIYNEERGNVEITEFSKYEIFDNSRYIVDSNGIVSNSYNLSRHSCLYLTERKYFRINEQDINEPFMVQETDYEEYYNETDERNDRKLEGKNYQFENKNVLLRIEKNDTKLLVFDSSNKYDFEFDHYENNDTKIKLKVIENENEKIIIEKEIIININKENNYLPQQKYYVSEFTLNDKKDYVKYKWYSQENADMYCSEQLVLSDIGLPLTIRSEEIYDDGNLYSNNYDINSDNEFFFSIKNFEKFNKIIPIICEEFGNEKTKSWDENYYLFDLIGRKKLEVNISNKIVKSFNIYQYSDLKDPSSIWMENYNILNNANFHTNGKIMLKYVINPEGLIRTQVFLNDFFKDDTIVVSDNNSLDFKINLKHPLTFTLFKVFNSFVLKNETDEDVKNGFIKKLIEKNFKIEYWNNLEVNHKISKTSSLNPFLNRNTIEVKYLNGQDIFETVNITISYYPKSLI